MLLYLTILLNFKEIHQLIIALCFLKIMIRHRKEVNATELQITVQIIFLKEKREGRKGVIYSLEAFLQRFQNN